MSKRKSQLDIINIASVRRAARELADAADAVGVKHFDTGIMSPEVERMVRAIQDVRDSLKWVKPKGSATSNSEG